MRCIGDDNGAGNVSDIRSKAIGMVGRKLPSATLSRCIFVELRRRKKDECVEKFKHQDDSELADLRRRLRRWAMDNQDILRNAKPSMPDELPNRRADNWQLQLAIADLCSGVEDFGDKARAAAIKIEGKADNRTIGVRLLADIKVLFDPSKATCMPLPTIVESLTEDPEKSWGEVLPRQVLDPKPSGTGARTLRHHFSERYGRAERKTKGYRRSDFEDSWAMYLC